MSKEVYCLKLKKLAPALSIAPYPGELGQKILQNISQEAWQMWLSHQTLLINEHRLSMIDPNARQFLASEMEAFLFGKGSEKPSGYTPINNS